jgi:hypothetical protein
VFLPAGRRSLTVLLGVSVSMMGVAAFGGIHAQAVGTPIFTESFANNSVPDPHWVLGGGGFTPCLTASGNTTVGPIMSCSGTTDGAGGGALRLTSNGGSESGYVFYNSPLPNTAGLDISFDSFQYNGTGADGIAFFLTDGQYQLVAPGTSGGYLGYAGGNHGIGNGNGVAHALFGVGLDAYGNFSNFENSPLNGGGNCPERTPTFVPNAVVLRGPGNADKVNYCYLAGAVAPRPLHVDSATNRTNGGLNNVSRRVHILVDPSSDPAPKVTVSIDGTQVLQAPEPAMTPTVKFGWTASTGGSTNIHEIQNVTAATVNPVYPALSVSNTVNSGGTFPSGGGVSGDAAYTITNGANANFETQPFTLTVPVPAGLGYTGTSVSDPNISCAATTATQLSCTYTPTGYGFAPGQSVTAHLLFSPVATYSQQNVLLTASVSSTDGGSPTANQTLQVTPRAVPNAITTTVNVPATVAQGGDGTAPFTWHVGVAANAALVASATVDTSGNITLTPVAGASGTTTVPLWIEDASGTASTTVQVPVTVRPSISPVVGSGTGPAPVYANVAPPVGTGPFTYSFASTPNAGTQGTAQFVAGSPEQVKFTPIAGFNGAVPTFTYQVTDAGLARSATATIDLTVNKPGNPTVAPVSGTIDANTTFTQTVPAPTGAGPFTYSIATAPSAGTETISNAGVVSFTPPTNSSDVYTSSYQTLDQYGQASAPALIRVTVRPVAVNFSGTTMGVSTLTQSAPTPAGTGPFTWISSPPQANGSLSMDSATGQVTFTANLGYTGTFSFAYTVSDGVAGTSSTAKSVTITVTTPPAPVAVAFASTQSADTIVSAQLPAPSSGTGTFTYAMVSPPSSGLLLLQPGGHIAFTPAPGTSGILTFTYRVTDPYGSSSLPATVTLNFHPVAADRSGSTVGPQPVTLAAGAVDGTGPFTYTLTQPPAPQGSATVNPADGAITFTPTLGFTGLAQFSYTVTGAGPTTSLPAQVFVTVTPPTAPVASALAGSTVSGGSTSMTASTNSGVGPFTYAIVLAASHGTTSLSGGNLLQYTSTAPYSGPDTFRYTTTDAYGTTSAPATVTVAVHPIAASPVLGSSTGPNAVLATPGAPTGSGPFTYNLVPGSLPPAGQGTTTEGITTGQIAFTPVVGFNGAVTFQYTVTDAYGLTSAPGTVDFSVNKPTGPGVAPASGTTPANTAVSITPPAAAGTVPLSYNISTPPARGAATISSTGVITYTPNANVSGYDSLQYTATDAYAQTSAPAMVTIAVTPSQPSGTAGPAVYPATFTANVPLPVGTGPFVDSVVSTTSGGSLTLNGSGGFSYTPAPGFSGPDSFTFRTWDGSSLASNLATESITVNTPGAPTVSNQSVTTTPNVLAHVDGTAGGTGTGALTYHIQTASNTSVATSTIDATTGQITFTPATNASGNTSATFYSLDAWGHSSNVATASLTIDPTSVDGSGGPAVYPALLPGHLPSAVGTGPFTYSVIGTATHGALVVNPDGSFTYSPSFGYVGTDTFTWSVADASGNHSATHTESIGVNAPASPTEADTSGTTNADTTLAVQLPAAAGGGGPFTYAVAATCSGFGAVFVDPNTGAGIFTPTTGMSGTTCFTYTATDSYGHTSSPARTYTLTVRPVAQNAAATDYAPAPVTATPGNPTGTGPFTWALAGAPASAQGSARVNSNTGADTFTPAAGFSGTARFTYTVTGANGVTSQPATVTITVVRPGAPTVAGVSAATQLNTAVSLTPPPPAGSGPFAWSMGAAPATGTATIDPTTGVMVFTPATGVSGTVTYTFIATDHYGTASAPATATVRVDPVAKPASMKVREGSGPVTIVLPAPGGTGPFTCALVTNPLPPTSEGTATVSTRGCSITYTLGAWSGGAVDFLYTVTDAAGLTSAPATVSFNVLAAATIWNGDGTSTPGTGAHLVTNALGSGSLVALGLLMLVLGIRRKRHDGKAGTAES